MAPYFFALFAAACLLAAVFGGRFLRWLSGPPPLPPGFHMPAPARPVSVRDRVALAQRRAHAREWAQADQEVRRG